MISIELNGVGVELAHAETPVGKIPVVIYTDPESKLRVIIPYGGDSAEVVAAHLTGRPPIIRAKGIIPPGQANDIFRDRPQG